MAFPLKQFTDGVTALKTAISSRESAAAAVATIDAEIVDAEAQVADLKTRRTSAETAHGTTKDSVVSGLTSLIDLLTAFRTELSPPPDPPEVGG